MKNKPVVVLMVLLGIFVSGCAEKRVDLYPRPRDPLYKEKTEFLDKYSRLVVPAEYEEFRALVDENNLRKFEENFWKKRDTDPRTPENEFKNIIDSRISDIKNEILFRDVDTPGVSFAANGGLRGEMAHVYILHGMPSFKERLREGNYTTELMVWYYVDRYNKPLFRFLFYKQYYGSGAHRLFKNHYPVINYDYLFDPLMSPLREISRRPSPTPEDLINLWNELEFNDPRWIFRAALFEFSYYSQDVVMEGGDIKKKKFGALDPPEPAALTAERFKPAILGQPEDLEGRKFIFNDYYSILPASFNIITNIVNGHPSFSIALAYIDLDWELKEKEAEAVLDLTISFQNKDTKAIEEFAAGIMLKGPRLAVESALRRERDVFSKIGKKTPEIINLDNFLNRTVSTVSREPSMTLRQLVEDKLVPGQYIVNVYLKHALTKKNNAWREEITIK